MIACSFFCPGYFHGRRALGAHTHAARCSRRGGAHPLVHRGSARARRAPAGCTRDARRGSSTRCTRAPPTRGIVRARGRITPAKRLKSEKRRVVCAALATRPRVWPRARDDELPPRAHGPPHAARGSRRRDAAPQRAQAALSARYRRPLAVDFGAAAQGAEAGKRKHKGTDKVRFAHLCYAAPFLSRHHTGKFYFCGSRSPIDPRSLGR